MMHRYWNNGTAGRFGISRSVSQSRTPLRDSPYRGEARCVVRHALVVLLRDTSKSSTPWTGTGKPAENTIRFQKRSGSQETGEG
jgi:hypothetical protein